MSLSRIHAETPVRCIGFVACTRNSCDHYNVHFPAIPCRAPRVKYCPRIKQWVADISVIEIDESFADDPNAAFKAMKEAEQAAQQPAYVPLDQYGNSIDIHTMGSREVEDDF